ncbi:hypothetical protein CYMTET_20912 [Cymbomonas tetramitiformis]|uniref:Uncharacterized protein n=1 Tax=Cymbomonas tetramitiformis TaxID=36881 RepID=A0AAE0G374_9CHLO|nr:hypothetical protein CYMTET_20912 [Cymbomonas tetramitiformis]
MCSWVTWERSAVMHKAPLSALVAHVGPALRAEHERTEDLRAHLARTFMDDLTTRTRTPSPLSARASSAELSASTGYTVAHGARGNEMAEEVIDSAAQKRIEAIIRGAEEATEVLVRRRSSASAGARMGRYTTSEASHDDHHGTRGQQLVNKDVAIGTSRGGMSTDGPRGRDEEGHGGRAPLSGRLFNLEYVPMILE